MSKEFSQFPDGKPILDTDKFLLGRPDASSPSGFSNYTVTAADLATFLGITLAANFLLLEDNSKILLEDGTSRLLL